MKHTKGPWTHQKTTIYKVNPGHTFEWVATTNRALAGLPEDQEREEANANLIAAAPDLYKILKVIVEQYTELPREVMEEIAPDWLLEAMEAVAKAEGEKK